jgi:hypothetical protein
MKLRDGQVLVPSHDHKYAIAWTSHKQVVWNRHSRSYSEYAGDDFLEDGDEVVTLPVVE